jgi:hypothetical protein
VKLITAHRILIAAGIAFFAFYAVFQVRRFQAGDGAPAVVQAVIAAAVAVGLAVYYRSLAGWGRR